MRSVCGLVKSTRGEDCGTHLKPFDSSCYFQSKEEVGFYVRFGFWGLLMVDLGEFSRGFLVLD